MMLSETVGVRASLADVIVLLSGSDSWQPKEHTTKPVFCWNVHVTAWAEGKEVEVEVTEVGVQCFLVFFIQKRQVWKYTYRKPLSFSVSCLFLIKRVGLTIKKTTNLCSQPTHWIQAEDNISSSAWKISAAGIVMLLLKSKTKPQWRWAGCGLVKFLF